MDGLEGSAATVSSRLRGTWSRGPATVGLLGGALLLLAGVSVGLAVGGPVLGHAGRPVVALGGAAAFGAGVLWMAKGWRGSARALRRLTAILTLLLTACFAVGTLTNPVVVDGQVYLSTSSQARSFRLMQQVRADLLELAAVDEYLTFDAAEAGAHYDAYPVLLERMTQLSSQYATTSENPSTLPDARFATVIDQTTAAAYWAARAVESKTEVIDADNAKSRADLDSHRAAYAQAVLQSGESLRALSAELGLPLTKIGPTE